MATDKPGWRSFFAIVAIQAMIFLFDVTTMWDDVSIGFLYIVPTLMAFFISGNRLRVLVVAVSITLILVGSVIPLPTTWFEGLDIDLPREVRGLMPPELIILSEMALPLRLPSAADLPLPVGDDSFVFVTNRLLASVTVLITGIMVYYRVKLEKTLSDALAKERRASALQRAFVSMVSHEFRTPLTIIDGEAYRILKIKDSITPENLERRSRSIRDAVQRLVNLIEKILYTSRAFDNKIEMKVVRVNLWTLLRSICVQHSQMSSGRHITLDLYDIPVSIKGDIDLLTYVFDNLIGNAVKYSPEGAEIEVSGGSEGGRAVISVRDQGIGIPPDDLQNLFEPYYRGRNVSGISGSGVGLYLVDSFVRLHGGKIVVDSTVGKGSVFTVSLPISAGG